MYKRLSNRGIAREKRKLSYIKIVFSFISSFYNFGRIPGSKCTSYLETRLFIPDAFKEHAPRLYRIALYVYIRARRVHKYKVDDLAPGQETVCECPTIFWILRREDEKGHLA